MTSHATLVLLNNDSSLNPWYVAINGIDTAPTGERNEFHIEYLMISDKQPWPNARVKGGTTSLNELLKYVVIAMTECGGWPDSVELKGLYGLMNVNK